MLLSLVVANKHVNFKSSVRRPEIYVIDKLRSVRTPDTEEGKERLLLRTQSLPNLSNVLECDLIRVQTD